MQLKKRQLISELKPASIKKKFKHFGMKRK